MAGPLLRMERHGDRVVRCFAERPANVVAMLERSFALAGDTLAVVDGDTRVTYRRLDAMAATLAGHLARSGVGKGDRVAVMLTNRLEAVLAIVAIARLGAIVLPIGTRSRRTEIEFLFEDATPIAILYEAAFAAELPPSGPAPALRIECGSPRWHALLDEPTAAPAVEIAEDDTFGLLYTSGTTGRPKGALLTHCNVVHSCLHWEVAFGMTRGERTALVVPWAHVSGLGGVVMPLLYLGGTLVMVAEFKRRAFLELAQKERITHALMVPAMYGLCLLEPDLASFDLKSWRLGVYGGAPMPEPTIRRFAQAHPSLQMCNAYGATETTSPTTIMPPGEGVTHSASIGKVVACGDVRVMNDQGLELPPGEEGELWIAGPMVIPGYWRNPEADAASFVGGYWKSGDIGAIDAEGFVTIADRKKDMIIRGGYKIYPAEVENQLTGLVGIVEAAVVGRPDDILGETVVAFLNVNAALDAPTVRAFCAERMADYKVPTQIVIARDPLPRNANGKIQKAELRARAQALPPVERAR